MFWEERDGDGGRLEFEGNADREMVRGEETIVQDGEGTDKRRQVGEGKVDGGLSCGVGSMPEVSRGGGFIRAKDFVEQVERVVGGKGR